MPPSDGDARKPPRGGASAVGGTRPNNSRSISILVSASRLSDCPTGAPLSVGSTPSSAGWTPPKRGWTPAVDDGPPSRGALVPSGQGRPPSSGGRAPSNPGRCHSCGNRAARGPSTRAGPVQRPRKAGLKFAAGVPRPKPGADRRIAVRNITPVTGVMAPLFAERVVAVPLSVAVPVKQCQSLAVDLDMPRAKIQSTQSPERPDDRAADPTAPVDSGAREEGEKRRIIGVGPRTVGE